MTKKEFGEVHIGIDQIIPNFEDTTPSVFPSDSSPDGRNVFPPKREVPADLRGESTPCGEDCDKTARRLVIVAVKSACGKGEQENCDGVRRDFCWR
jgi:hypothetical protein